MGVLRVTWKVEVDMVEPYQKNYSVDNEDVVTQSVWLSKLAINVYLILLSALNNLNLQ